MDQLKNVDVQAIIERARVYLPPQRQKTLSILLGTFTGGYLISKSLAERFTDFSDRSRRARLEQDNVQRRFNLSMQDCHFTILALLPGLAKDINELMDVESVSAELARLTKEAKNPPAAEKQPVVENGYHVVDTASNDAPETKPDGQEASSPVNGVEHEPNGHSAPAEMPNILPGFSQDTSNEPTSKLDQPSRAFHAPLHSPLIGGYAFNSQPFVAPAPKQPPPEKIEAPEAKAEHDEPASEVSPPEAESSPPIPTVTRAQLWAQIKVLSFTRTLTTIYSLSLLVILTHIQLLLLAREGYVDSVKDSIPRRNSQDSLQSSEGDRDLEKANGRTASFDEEGETIEERRKNEERKFLTIAYYFLHYGWRDVHARVELAAEDLIPPMGLKQELVYGELPALFSQLRNRIEGPSPSFPAPLAATLSALLLPPSRKAELATLKDGGIPESSLHISSNLRRLLDEAADFLASPDCVDLHSSLLSTLFSQLVGALEQPFRSSDRGYGGGRFEDVTENKARLASVLPVLARKGREIAESNPNEWVDSVGEVKELREWSALVYASWDREVM